MASVSHVPIITSQGSTVPRYPQHDNAIANLVTLRDRYDVNSAEYLAIDALCETVNRLGGVITHDGSRYQLLSDDMPAQVAVGLETAAHYIRTGKRSSTRLIVAP